MKFLCTFISPVTGRGTINLDADNFQAGMNAAIDRCRAEGWHFMELALDYENADEATYRSMLASHDWTFEYSDDHSVWRQGKEARAKLYSMQAKLDPDWRIWNEVAPEMYRMRT